MSTAEMLILSNKDGKTYKARFQCKTILFNAKKRISLY